MVVQSKLITVEAFEAFIARPENMGRNFELIAGEIVEKMVANPRSSTIAAFVLSALLHFVRQRGLGRVTGADGGYAVSGEKYIPDAAYISKQRQPIQPSEAYNPLPPDLAVEVLSPSNSDEEMRIKVANYQAAGTLLWVVDPERQRVEVYRSGQPPRILGLGDTLSGGDLLPGFTLAISDIFAE